MSPYRAKWGLVALLVLMAGAVASAQGLQDMQLFAPVDTDTFGGGPRPNEGYFFKFDGLMWWIAAPEKTTIGFEGLTRNVYYYQPSADPLLPEAPVMALQSNSHDNGFVRSEVTGGERYDFGYMSGHHGWLASITRLTFQSQRATVSDVDVVFSDPPFGPTGQKWLEGYVDTALTRVEDLPLTFPEVVLQNRLEMWGAEWNYVYRMHPNHHGGIFEWFLGVRYLELHDYFNVDAPTPIDAGPDGSPDGLMDSLGNTLGPGYWYTKAENHIVGPQVAVRWLRKQDRWTWSAEGRFFAGFNSQNIRQQVSLGSELFPPGRIVGALPTDPPQPGLPLAMGPTNANHSTHANEWSPAAELRIELTYQLTRAISCDIGWTGLWIDGIARGSNMIVYELPRMGIDMANNRQGTFVNGINIGVSVNR